MRKNEVKAFRGLRYNLDRVPDLSNVITPPYDVMTPDLQSHYYNKSPYSSIRLDFALANDTDSETDNQYTRAGADLDRWLREGIITVDAGPSLYWCREEYHTPAGETASREGFFAALRLVDFSEGLVLPHEQTSPGPKADRLALMEATEANLSPIFCLYSDPGHEVNTRVAERIAAAPDAVAEDEAGTRHSLWVIDDPALVESVESFMADRTLMIADGHHRYETALAYRDQQRQRAGDRDSAPHDYMLVYLSNTDNPGMSIFPLHRLVSGLTPETMASLIGRLERYFDVDELDADKSIEELLRRMREHGSTHNSFGIHVAASDSYFMVIAREPKPMLPADGESRSIALRSLDAAVLDEVILADVLDIRTGGANETAAVRFVERAEMSAEEIARAEHQLMIMVNPTTMEEVKAISEAGEKMPKKSTYFYPKPVTGLVFRSFRY